MIDQIANIGCIILALGIAGMFFAAIGILLSWIRSTIQDREFALTFITIVGLMLVMGLGIIVLAVVLLLWK